MRGAAAVVDNADVFRSCVYICTVALWLFTCVPIVFYVPCQRHDTHTHTQPDEKRPRCIEPQKARDTDVVGWQARKKIANKGSIQIANRTIFAISSLAIDIVGLHRAAGSPFVACEQNRRTTTGEFKLPDETRTVAAAAAAVTG